MDRYPVNFGTQYIWNTGSNYKQGAILRVARMLKSTIDIVSVANSELGSYGSHMDMYPWYVDMKYIALETTGVFTDAGLRCQLLGFRMLNPHT